MNKLVVAFVVLSFSLLKATPVSQKAELYVGPFSVNVTTKTADVVWVSQKNDSSILTINPHDTTVSIVIKKSNVNKREEVIHRAHLDNLIPGKLYSYSIGAGSSNVQGSFSTMNDTGKSCSFVIYGDSRSRPEMHKKLCSVIAQEKASFVLCNGDLTADGDQWDLWKQEFFGPASSHLVKTAFVPIRGNHEGSGVLYRNLFNIPSNRGLTSYDCGDVHVVVIDQYADTGKVWLTKLKKETEADLTKSKARWKIVCLHQPMFNVAGHGSTWGQNDFLPMFEQSGVDVVFAGHSHLYERFLPIGTKGKKPILHIVSGGGGVDNVDPKPSPIIEGGIGKSISHFCAVKVSGDSLSIKVKNIEGKVIDKVSLVKKDGIYQKEVMDKSIEIEAAKQLIFLLDKLTLNFNYEALRDGKDSIIAIEGFPNKQIQAQLTISSGSLCKEWKVVPQQCSLATISQSVKIKVHPWNKLSVDGMKIKPDLKLKLALTFNGRVFTSDNVILPISGATICSAVPVARPYIIPHCKATVTIDGSLSDWGNIEGMPLPLVKRDHSPFHFAWDEKGLYFGYEVVDTTKSYGSAPWSGDGFELFIDKQWSRATGFVQTGVQYGFGIDTTKKTKSFCVVGWGDTISSGQISSAYTPTKKGYILEGFIPAKCFMVSKLVAGNTWGFNFTRNDNGKPIEQFYSDKSKDNGFITPLLWGAVTLAPNL